MTDPSLFTPHEPPAISPTPVPRRRPARTATVLGASLVALLIVGGSAVALLAPEFGGGDARAAQVDLATDFSDIGEPDLLADAPAEPPAPAPVPAAGKGKGKDGDGRQFGLGRARVLGDDTLIVGTIVSTADGSIVVTSDSGGDRTIRTNNDTRVRGVAKAALGSLKAGDRAVVRVSGSGDAATAVTIVTPRPRVAGTVTQIAGDVATIKKVDGTTEPASIAAVNPKPAVGDLVVLSGKSTNGNTITADRIHVLPRAS